MSTGAALLSCGKLTRWVRQGARRKALAARRVAGDEPAKPQVVDTLGGRMHVRWDEAAAATPHGQLVFFAEFLAATGVFERWVSECPLAYRSGNASDKRDVLGTLMLGLLAGCDPRDPACQAQPVPDHARGLGPSVKGLRIGVIGNHFMDRNTADVQACIEARLADPAHDGAKLVHVQMPILDYGLAAIFAIELASSGAYHDRSVAEGRSAHFEPDVRDLVEMGRLVSAVDYLKAEQVRAAGRDESVLVASWRLTCPFNLTGLPAISVPAGFGSDGMPIGLQIAARPFAEAQVLQCAAAVERRLMGPPKRPLLD